MAYMNFSYGFELAGKLKVIRQTVEKMAAQKKIELSSEHFAFIEEMVHFDHEELKSTSLRGLLMTIEAYLGRLKRTESDSTQAFDYDYKKKLRQAVK